MEKINEQSLKKYTGLDALQAFSCDFFGMSATNNPNTIAFADTEKFIDQINSNSNITVVITNELLCGKLKDKVVILCEDPRYSYYQFSNGIGETNYITFPSQISPSAQIHHRAFVSEHNVIIGDNTIVGPNTSILADVEIGSDCVINSGVSLGNSGYEFKRTSKGILPVFHDGKVIIKNRVRVGANTAIDKGFSFRHTIIEDDVKIDDLVYIAHGGQIGEGTFLVGHVMISGSTTVGKNVWVGPGAILSSSITIGDHAFISLGSIVNRNVGPGEHVTGNFAIEHKKFIENLKKNK